MNRRGKVLEAMRKAARDYEAPKDACVSYRALYDALETFEKDLQQHIHLENNILFPAVVELEDCEKKGRP
jgi:regulator of cell morphogenesis and NO signaling